MIKIRQIFGLTIVTGTCQEINCLWALNGTDLKAGDRLTLLPAKHHIHRNPRPALLKRMEDGPYE